MCVVYNGEAPRTDPLFEALLFAHTTKELRKLEKAYGLSQRYYVNVLIEEGGYGQWVPHLVGGHGTNAERLKALKTALRERQRAERVAKSD